MSFKKFQVISPVTIGSPEAGHIYLGRDEYGLWEKYPDGGWVYIITGGTTGAGTSGTSGGSGSSGRDGTFMGSSGTSGKEGTSGTTGTSGSSGRSGFDGTSGSSAIGSSGTSGSSGKTGTSGTSGSSGFTGTSGSSGKDGTFYGSSGTSGLSGYGGSSRKWSYTTTIYPTVPGTFYAGTPSFSGIEYIRVNQQDGDSQLLDNWIKNWTNGIFKIEQYNDPSKFGIYTIVSGITTVTKPGLSWYLISGVTCYDGNGVLSNGETYLLSYVPASYGTSGAQGSSGTSGAQGPAGPSGGGGSSGTSGSAGTSGSSGQGANFNVDQDLYYETSTNTLFTPNVYLTGSTVTITNIQNVNDNNTKLILSSNVISQVTGVTPSVQSLQYYSPKYTTTSSIDWNNGNVQYHQLANGATSLSFSNPTNGGKYVLILKQPSSGANGTASWPGDVLWAGGTPPTLTVTNNKVDIINFIYDSTNSKYYGNYTLNY